MHARRARVCMYVCVRARVPVCVDRTKGHYAGLSVSLSLLYIARQNVVDYMSQRSLLVRAPNLSLVVGRLFCGLR